MDFFNGYKTLKAKRYFGVTASVKQSLFWTICGLKIGLTVDFHHLFVLLRNKIISFLSTATHNPTERKLRLFQIEKKYKKY